ncbi:hypothetical protein LGM90_28410 [Burkholderia sp. AU28942]|uniref:hypothetical protein n=1 Tax=Burkholderia TaxID=32008 RepID=UPI00142E5E2E|nr:MULTISPECIES: hypothetical protein [Burkholderia]MCA8312439.1 hypothetical protein [Burkholderia sp. AU28942]
MFELPLQEYDGHSRIPARCNPANSRRHNRQHFPYKRKQERFSFNKKLHGMRI